MAVPLVRWVRCWLLTVKAQVQSYAVHVGFVVKKSGTVAGFSASTLVFPCQSSSHQGSMPLHSSLSIRKLCVIHA